MDSNLPRLYTNYFNSSQVVFFTSELHYGHPLTNSFKNWKHQQNHTSKTWHRMPHSDLRQHFRPPFPRCLSIWKRRRTSRRAAASYCSVDCSGRVCQNSHPMNSSNDDYSSLISFFHQEAMTCAWEGVWRARSDGHGEWMGRILSVLFLEMRFHIPRICEWGWVVRSPMYVQYHHRACRICLIER